MGYNVSGIYCIRNLVNGNLYIGSSVNIEGRWNGHEQALLKGTHVNSYLQNAFNKYGADNFIFDTLILCDKDMLIYYEQQLLEHWKPVYNLCPNAGSSLGYKHSDESKRSMSESRKGRITSEETRRKLSKVNKGNKYGIGNQNMKGKKLSEETRRKMSEAHKGNQYAKGFKHSDDTRKKYSEHRKGNQFAKGYKHSDDTKKRMSETRKGRKAWNKGIPNPNKGVPLSDEVKRKMSEAHKCHVPWNKGKPCSDETKHRISEANRKRFAERKSTKLSEVGPALPEVING